MKLLLVSIIIPLYNAEQFIVETINSALAQTYKNIEIIIVDDGSTDNSLALAKQFEGDKVKVYFQENKGASAARNYGLRQAKGDYIQFLDADDLLAVDKIEKQVAILQENPNSISSCKYVKFVKNIQSTIGPIGPHQLLAKDLSPLDWFLANHTMLIHAWLCPKNIIDNAGFWDKNLSLNDDGEYFARVVFNAEKILFCDNTMVYYRDENGNSISQLNSETKMKSGFLAAAGIEETLLKLRNADNEKIINKTIGENYKKLLFVAYPEYPALYYQYKNHWALKYSTLKYNAGGNLAKAIYILFGWKFLTQIKKVNKQKLNLF